MGILMITLSSFFSFFFLTIRFLTRSWYLLFPILFLLFHIFNSGSRGTAVLLIDFSVLFMLDVNFNSEKFFLSSLLWLILNVLLTSLFILAIF